MTNTLKILLTLIAVMGLLAGCSSTNTTDEPTPEPTMEPTPEPTEEPEASPMDQLSGLDNVFYFDFDQSILKAEARSALMIYAEVLKDNPTSVRVEGHADERGTREYNMALGERRANAVRDFLVLQGVDAAYIETVSYGEERPLAMGSDEESWAQNRRAELILSM